MFERLRQWWHCRKHKQDYQKKWPELPVHHLVYYTDNPECGAVIVFIDWTGDLDWQRDDKAEALAKRNGGDGDFAKVVSEVALLEPRVAHWPRDLKVSVKRLLGESLARALCADGQAALESLKATRKFVRDKGKEVSRYWTLQACTLFAGAAVLVGVTVAVFAAQVIKTVGYTPYVLLLAASCGAVGAFLSVVLRLGSLNGDARAERMLHYAEAAARVFAGSVFGVLVGALVRLGVLFPVFSQSGLVATAVCAAAIIAGASERLVPGIIARAENEESKEKGG